MRKLVKPWNWIMGVLAFLWFLFLLYTAVKFAFHPLLQGGVCVTFAMVFVFIMYPGRRGSDRHKPSWVDVGLAILTLLPGLYLVMNWEYFVTHPMAYTPADTVIGALFIPLAFEATRRSEGWALPIVALCALGYTFGGQFIPSQWGHGGFDIGWVTWYLYQTTDGYWGSVTWALAATVPMYIIFAPVLFAIGAGPPLLALARWVGGKVRGGAAQAAVVGSSFFGMFSGSPVANVMTVGTFTIPAMKSVGFDSNFAGAVEAVASTGGMITPPVLGTAAFIMAQYLGLPYVNIMIYSIIPAFLYYSTLFLGIFLYASKKGIGRLPAHIVGDVKREMTLRALIVVIVPLGLLLLLLFRGLSAPFSAAMALLIAMLLHMAVGSSYHIRDLKQRVFLLGSAVNSGVKAFAGVMIICFVAQITVALLSFSGIAAKFSSTVVTLGEGYLLLSLVLAAAIVFVLGMAMPAVGAYVVGVAVIAPALLKLGIAPVLAHFFVFYSAALSCITPPVCLAVYPAAAIAGGNWVKTAFIAVGLGMLEFVVPVLIVYYPGLLFQGSVTSTLVSVANVAVALVCLQSAWSRYFLKRLNIVEIILLASAGILLLAPEMVFKGVGAGLLVLALLSQRFATLVPVVRKRFGA